MSQDTFPFAPGEDMGQYDETDAANKKKLLVAGGLVAALVLGAGGFLFLGGGDSAEGDVFIPRAPRVGQAAAAPKAPAKAVAKKLPVAYDEQIGRNPFQALYVVSAVAPAAPASTTSSTTSTSTSSSTTSTTPTSSGTTSSGTGTTPTAPVVTEHKLVLTRVYGTGDDRTGVFTIDGKEQVAKIGSKFGPTQEILLLSFQQGPKAGQWTTVLQVGDGAPFDVVTGAVTYVR